MLVDRAVTAGVVN